MKIWKKAKVSRLIVDRYTKKVYRVDVVHEDRTTDTLSNKDRQKACALLDEDTIGLEAYPTGRNEVPLSPVYTNDYVAVLYEGTEAANRFVGWTPLKEYEAALGKLVDEWNRHQPKFCVMRIVQSRDSSGKPNVIRNEPELIPINNPHSSQVRFLTGSKPQSIRDGVEVVWQLRRGTTEKYTPPPTFSRI